MVHPNISYPPSLPQACQLPLFEYVAERMCDLCYLRAWYSKYGGCRAIKSLYERMSFKWVLDHQYMFLKALLFVINDLTMEVNNHVVAVIRVATKQKRSLGCT